MVGMAEIVSADRAILQDGHQKAGKKSILVLLRGAGREGLSRQYFTIKN